MSRPLIAVLAVVLAVAGCSSSKKAAPTTTRPSSSTSTSAYSPTPGADAALIAGHIPGCSDVQSGDIGKGGPSLSSTATCTLGGHLVIVDSWSAGAAGHLSPTYTRAYYAYGLTWTAFLADQGATAKDTTLQMQLTNDAGGLLQQGIDQSAHPHASPDAQQQLVAAIAQALGGTVDQTTG